MDDGSTGVVLLVVAVLLKAAADIQTVWEYMWDWTVVGWVLLDSDDGVTCGNGFRGKSADDRYGCSIFLDDPSHT